ncbi:Bin3-domain-containing protein [Auricularia subglabra TFB-10046 SS5]|nr:Bin3-domain-containing protein [Auricularia subglabra TFB-10046 SS5]
MPPRQVPVHGNYHGYYGKRVTDQEGDVRLALLPADFFSNNRVLDVGCNEGWVTCEIAQSRGASEVIGVDIDPDLVALAWKRRRYLWSLSEPPRRRLEDGTPDQHYFPAALQHMFGPLVVPGVASESDKATFPHNVSFVAADWAADGIAFDAKPYDVVLALSITKWIHLNDGDDGIRAFFRRVHAVLKPGGAFLLEIQPWDSYAKARRMHPTLKENAAKLQLRPENFGELLVELGFTDEEFIGAPGDGGFCRPLRIYRKKI